MKNIIECNIKVYLYSQNMFPNWQYRRIMRCEARQISLVMGGGGLKILEMGGGEQPLDGVPSRYRFCRPKGRNPAQEMTAFRRNPVIL